MRNTGRTLAVGVFYSLLLAASAGTAYAGATTVASVPEIDSGSMAAAAGILIGGYLLIVSKFRRK